MTSPLSRAYKNFTPRMGIYAARCVPSGQVWLDHSSHVEGSLNRHRFQLQAGLHPIAALQQAWKQGGEQLVRLELLDELPYDPTQPSDHDYSAELYQLEALWRENLHLPERPPAARGLRP